MQFVIDNDGDIKAKVSINDSPITFDDEYNLVLKVRPVINVVEIKSNSQQSIANSQSSYLELIFKDDALVNYHAMSSYGIDQQVINNAQMIVVNEKADLNETIQQSLLDFASQGGTLLILNDENADNAYIYDEIGIRPMHFDENENRIEYIAKRNSFFDDIFVKLPENADLPKINKHICFDLGKNVLNVISLQNGNPLLMVSDKGKGKIFVMSTSLNEEYSDLANHALFVPLMYKMALIGGGISDLSYTLGVDNIFDISAISLDVDDVVSIKDENALFEMFPLVEKRNNHNYISFFENLPSSGFYDVCKNEEVMMTVAWNDKRDESEMSFFDKEGLEKILKDNKLNILAMVDYDELGTEDVMDIIVKDSVIWKILVIIALISLLIEILILRFWKS